VGRKRDKASTAAIQKLLDERKQIEQWLVRLEKAADRTPEAVRTKVRSDYESRLHSVVRELQGFEDELRASLEEVQARCAAARDQERQATEELSEAELRFTVGEFGDAEWSEKKTGLLDRLIRIREDIGQAEEEISELEEVLRSIAAPTPATAPAAGPAAEPEIAELEEVEEETEARTAKPAPSKPADRLSLGAELGLRHLPAAAKAAAPAKTAAKPQEQMGGELEFLKALSDEKASPRPARVSGAQPRPVPAEKPAAEKPRPVENLTDQQALSRSRPSVINQRTLKCGECGAMNLPTEWYCDRCGAELASL
jgi:hypothetical protein